MKNLWAPWRVAYIQQSPKENVCFLCESFNNNHDDKSLIVYRSKESFCILNKYPYNSGHLMVAPNNHKADISELTDHELLEIMKLTAKMKGILTKLMAPEGFNIGINLGKPAGAGLLGHIHVHIVPRWNGDTNFMPVISEAKVISQSLENLYKEFKKQLV
ncbi:MAG: HIT domain-containing protein [Candidatus Brocadiaceae bacterium]|nr:HIT domain-containing protein [Candidatus Brocadiaceae bacterium]